MSSPSLSTENLSFVIGEKELFKKSDSLDDAHTILNNYSRHLLAIKSNNDSIHNTQSITSLQIVYSIIAIQCGKLCINSI